MLNRLLQGVKKIPEHLPAALVAHGIFKVISKPNAEVKKIEESKSINNIPWPRR